MQHQFGTPTKPLGTAQLFRIANAGDLGDGAIKQTQRYVIL